MGFKLFLWAGATVAHCWLTAAAVRAFLPARRSLDEWIFATALGAVATLSLVLHVVATTSGLSLSSGLIGLAVWHSFLWWAVRRHRPGSVQEHTPFNAFELGALAVFLGILLTWVIVAASSADLYGPDATHYHVPYAVNIAGGDGLFGLPATPHLYPMGGSVVAAWFIVPLADPLLVDLSMVLPFALLVTAINYLFRAMTGLSGTAWSSWLSLTLFATPLFRSASAGAADLWFAAGFACMLAIAVAAWSRGAWRGIDVWLMGCALGLLAGSKTTGIAAAGLLVIAAAATSILRAALGSPTEPRREIGVGAFLIAGTMAVGAGGIWLLRNWIQFGSPLAPAGLQLFGMTIIDGETHQRTTYFSVLGEMQNGTLDLWSRGAFFVRRWLGAAFLPASTVAVVMLVDLAATFAQRKVEPRWWARVGCILLVGGAGGVLIYMLIGAPWTALERSGGLTLRYALPVAALLPLTAFVGLFPLRLPWFEQANPLPRVILSMIAAAGLWSFYVASAGTTGSSALPPLDPRWLAVGAAMVFSLAHWRSSGSRRSMAIAAGILGLIMFLTFQVQAADAAERNRAAAAFEAEEAAFAGGSVPSSGWRALFLAVRDSERTGGVSCAARRFFSLTRDDEPMALQPPEMTSRIYYAGRDVEAARRAGPIHSCDYIITTPAVQATDKGRELVEALRGDAELEAATTTPAFVVLRKRR